MVLSLNLYQLALLEFVRLMTSQKECRTQSEAVTHLGFLAVSSTVSASIRMDAASIGVTLYDGFPMRVKCFVVQKKKKNPIKMSMSSARKKT